MFGNQRCLQRDFGNRSRSLGVDSRFVSIGRWFGMSSVVHSGAEADVFSFE